MTDLDWNKRHDRKLAAVLAAKVNELNAARAEAVSSDD